MIIALVVFIVTIIVCVLAYLKLKFTYWRNKRVPYIDPQIPFGNLENPFSRKQNTALVIQHQYQHFKSLGYHYGGLYLSIRPALLLVDINLIKTIMSKDFHYFTDRGTYYNEKHDPLSANLFNLEGHKWRNLRAKLTTTFTSGKMKSMFPTLVACGDPLYTAVHKLNEEKVPLDIKDLLARFTTDVIGSCAFGLECNSFSEQEDDFRRYGMMTFSPFSNVQSLKFLIAVANPRIARRLGISISDNRPKKFFLDVVKKTVSYRERKNVVRNDFMQLLMELRENNTGEGLTIEQIAAQAFIFFLAGFETSSTTMTFCLYELAINEEVQNKVREEITIVIAKHEGCVTYDAIMEMKYLNQVIEETLRNYPPLAVLSRVCVQDYKIPDTDIIVDKGTRITIPTYALHHDPEYFPEPEKFNPERFSDQNKVNITPYSYIPFGEGPRICIGLRFGLLQTKVGLVVLLRHFKFSLNAKTNFPVQPDKYSFILTADKGIWLDSERISQDTL